MRRSLVMIFALLFWFIGTNHCAIEGLLGASHACPFETSKAATSHDSHGDPCSSLTGATLAKATLTNPASGLVNLDLHTKFFVNTLISLVVLEKPDVDIPTDNVNYPASKSFLLVSSPNAPPLSI